MFVGSQGITYGWKATLENYKKGYPDRATMGKLKFDFVNHRRIQHGRFRELQILLRRV